MTHAPHATETAAALIRDAVSHQATDIHISCKGDEFEIRYCIHGLVTIQSRFANDDLRRFAEALNSFMEGPGESELSRCASGVARISLDDGSGVQIRLARMPGHPGGYELIAKILVAWRTTGQRPFDLSSLGYSSEQMRAIRRHSEERSAKIRMPIVAGRTGVIQS